VGDEAVVPGPVLASVLSHAGLACVEDDPVRVPASAVAANRGAGEIEQEQPNLAVTRNRVAENAAVADRTERDACAPGSAGLVARHPGRVRAAVHVDPVSPVALEPVSYETAPRRSEDRDAVPDVP